MARIFIRDFKRKNAVFTARQERLRGAAGEQRAKGSFHSKKMLPKWKFEVPHHLSFRQHFLPSFCRPSAWVFGVAFWRLTPFPRRWWSPPKLVYML